MRYSDYNKSERTRKFIIEKAAPVFNKKGFEGTSLSDLTKATGLTKGCIYGNFKNKEEIAVAAFEYNADFITKNLRKAIEAADTQMDKLLSYPATFRKIFKAVQGIGGCPILNTAVDTDDGHAALHEKVVQRIQLWKKTMIRIMENGKAAGEFHPETDAGKTADIIICLVEGGYAMAKTMGSENFMIHAVDEVERIVKSLGTVR